jgi:hypothetical protein
MGRWLRMQPSGFVHWVTPSTTVGMLDTACGQKRPAKTLTANFPSMAKRCPMCKTALSAEDRG